MNCTALVENPLNMRAITQWRLCCLWLQTSVNCSAMPAPECWDYRHVSPHHLPADSKAPTGDTGWRENGLASPVCSHSWQQCPIDAYSPGQREFLYCTEECVSHFFQHCWGQSHHTHAQTTKHQHPVPLAQSPHFRLWVSILQGPASKSQSFDNSSLFSSFSPCLGQQMAGSHFSAFVYLGNS
jgi:hypothetical protein